VQVDKAQIEMAQLKEELTRVKSSMGQEVAEAQSGTSVQAKLIANLQEALNQALTSEESMKGEVRRTERNHHQEKAALHAKISILQTMAGLDGAGPSQLSLETGSSAQSKFISALETRLSTARQERDHANGELQKAQEELSEFRGTSSEVKKLNQHIKFNELAWNQEKTNLFSEIQELKAKLKVQEAELGVCCVRNNTNEGRMSVCPFVVIVVVVV
jgi:hypothetical protein